MDFNLPETKQDLKKGAAAASQLNDELIKGLGHVAAPPPAAKSPASSFDLLGDVVNEDVAKLSGNDGKSDMDFEHVNSQTFISRAAEGAREKVFNADEYDEFLAASPNYFGQVGNKETTAMADLTRDFMNAERDFLGQQQKKKEQPPPLAAGVAATAPPAPVDIDDDLLVDTELISQPQQKKPEAPTDAQKITDFYDDDFVTTATAPKASTAGGVSAKTTDLDTDSPLVSYNPSPVRKNPVTDALKEQDNEKFISSEDLLGDFKEERTETPEFNAAAESHTATNPSNAPLQNPTLPTTDLDDDDDDDDDDEDSTPVPPQKPAPSIPAHTKKVEEIKETTPEVIAAAPKPAPVVDSVQKPPTTAPANVTSRDTTKQTPKEEYENVAKGPKIVSVEEIFYKYGLDAWFKPERLHPRVESLIYWRDVKKSGIVFGAGLVTLLAISCFSVISVFAYLSLISLTGTIGFRIYKTVMQAIQKTSEGHPFKEFLELDLTLSQEKVQQICSVAVAHINGFSSELRRLFLVEDLVDSLKFGVILWVMTYIGAWFNGMTLVILAFVSLFTLPKVYENNKQSIDTYLDLVRSKLTEITDKVKVAIPIGNKKPIAAESDKDK